VIDDGVTDTDGLLDEVVAILRRFIVWQSEDQAVFVALWVLHTYVFERFETTPYLDVTSAAKQSGKTRLLIELLPLLVARPWPVFDASEAVLFRKIDQDHPTLLVDEVDATFGKDAKVTEGLRAIFNVGYRQGAMVPRCVGNNHEPTDFNVYGPKGFAGLKGLPDTVKDRSGRIELKRRSRSEPKPERLRPSKLRPELEPLAGKLTRWAKHHGEALAEARPVLPESLSDRAQDGCEVLAAIADLAGCDWPTRAAKAFPAVMGRDHDEDLGVILLGHCREAFDGRDRLTTAEMLRALVDRGDDSPWAGWWGKDLDDGNTRKPAMKLAQSLKPYDIHAKALWTSTDGKGKSVRGFERDDFVDAWERYLAP